MLQLTNLQVGPQAVQCRLAECSHSPQHDKHNFSAQVIAKFLMSIQQPLATGAAGRANSERSVTFGNFLTALLVRALVLSSRLIRNCHQVLRCQLARQLPGSKVIRKRQLTYSRTVRPPPLDSVTNCASSSPDGALPSVKVRAPVGSRPSGDTPRRRQVGRRPKRHRSTVFEICSFVADCMLVLRKPWVHSWPLTHAVCSIIRQQTVRRCLGPVGLPLARRPLISTLFEWAAGNGWSRVHTGLLRHS
jgi:hypothetical protein